MTRSIALLTLTLGLCGPTTALAWLARVHAAMTERALTEIGDSIPLTAAARTLLVRASQQPDLMRPRELPMLRDIEAARHYIDLELLSDRALPSTTPEFYRLLVQLSEDPAGRIPSDWNLQSIGTVPYALVESTQRLAAVFAQVRRLPADAELQAMAAILGGTVAHYAQDLCQPLHTTIHHDGRAGADGRSPQSGIHRLVDGLPAALGSQLDEIEIRPPRSIGDLFPAVMAALSDSHAEVDEVYRQEAAIRQLMAGGDATSALRALVLDRFEHSVTLTADLLQTAWERSDTIELPGWAESPPRAGD